jgi:hypothetical protein
MQHLSQDGSIDASTIHRVAESMDGVYTAERIGMLLP